jgi:TolA-binding protein
MGFYQALLVVGWQLALRVLQIPVALLLVQTTAACACQLAGTTPCAGTDMIDPSTDDTEDAEVDAQATQQVVQLQRQVKVQKQMIQRLQLQQQVLIQKQVMQRLQQQLLEMQQARRGQGHTGPAVQSGLDMLAAAAMGSKP